MAATLTFHADGYRPGTRQRPHRHDELHLSLVLSGRVAETVGRVTEWAQPLSVVAKDAGLTHADDFGPGGARMARLTLGSGTVAALIDDPARARPWHWTHDPMVARHYLKLVRRAAGQSCTIAADDPDLVDLLAGLTARPTPSSHKTAPAWLRETMEHLRQQWHPRVTVRDVASRARVHPVYLARCVRRWYGTGVSDELRRLRIQSAAFAIADQPSTLSCVAHSFGFADEAHMCRAFRRASGLTPARYRALVGRLDYTWRGRSST